VTGEFRQTKEGSIPCLPPGSFLKAFRKAAFLAPVAVVKWKPN